MAKRFRIDVKFETRVARRPMSRAERLAALNGHSLVFVCFGCGGVHRIDKAAARIGTTAKLISADCLVRAYRTNPAPLVDNLITMRD